MLQYVQTGLYKLYTQFTERVLPLFSAKTLDNQHLADLQKLLLQADTGSKTTNYILNLIKEQHIKGQICEGTQLKIFLTKLLNIILQKHPFVPREDKPAIILMGINGSGKTTVAAKLAYRGQTVSKKPLLVAADTFRAAAIDQLEQLASQHAIPVARGKEGQDPASVVFSACQLYKGNQHSMLVVDTAGRLQTNTNLMNELKKINRILEREIGANHIQRLLVIDSIIGQNSLDQARTFHQNLPVDGIIISKMDGIGKGGIVFAIAHELEIPIAYISHGPDLGSIDLFDSFEYVKNLVG